MPLEDGSAILPGIFRKIVDRDAQGARRKAHRPDAHRDQICNLAPQPLGYRKVHADPYI